MKRSNNLILLKIIIIVLCHFIFTYISYAGYVTITEERVSIGDGEKTIAELPFLKRVEVLGQIANRSIIKFDNTIGVINIQSLRFPIGEQPYVYPKWSTEPVYEISLELLKGEEFKVVNETQDKYLIEYPLENKNIEIWIDKKSSSYNELSALERFEQEQLAKGLVKYKDKWVTPDEKFELEQKEKCLIKYDGKWLTYDQVQEAKGLVKFRGEWITPKDRDKIMEKDRILEGTREEEYRRVVEKFRESEEEISKKTQKMVEKQEVGRTLGTSITGQDDGYKWQSTHPEARVNLCKDIVRRSGRHDWKYYYDGLESFYSEPLMLKIKISEASALLAVLPSKTEQTTAVARAILQGRISKKDLEIHNYLQDRWDFYEKRDGRYIPELHDDAVFSEASEYFGLNKDKIEEIFNKVEEIKYEK